MREFWIDDQRTDGRLWARLAAPWEAAYGEEMRRRGVDALTILEEQPLEFLLDLTFLRSLVLLFYRPGFDLSVINELSWLEGLGLSVLGSRKGLRLSSLRRLKRYSADWVRGDEHVFNIETIEDLRLGKFPFECMEALRMLVRLRVLMIHMSRKLQSLCGLEFSQGLEKLSLAYLPNLRDVSATAALRRLRDLEIVSCKRIEKLEVVLPSLTSLQRLHLENGPRLPSLAFVRAMPELDRISFHGTSVIEDGDMTPLLERKFGHASYDNRRHYSHPWQQVPRRACDS